VGLGGEYKAFVIEAREKRGLQPGLLQLKYKLSKDPVCHLTSVCRKIASGDQHKIIYYPGNKFPLNHSTPIHEKKKTKMASSAAVG